MAMKDQSFVLKRGEGLNNKNLIKHTIYRSDSPRASSVDATAAGAIPIDPRSTKYTIYRADSPRASSVDATAIDPKSTKYTIYRADSPRASSVDATPAGATVVDPRNTRHTIYRADSPRASSVDATAAGAIAIDPKSSKHMIYRVDTPRALSVDTTPAGAIDSKSSSRPMAPVKTSYISPMARARQLATQRRGTAGSDSTGASKDWDESTLPSSTSPSNNSDSTVSSTAATPFVSKYPKQRLIPYSGGLIPSPDSVLLSSGYVPKSGMVKEEEDCARLPKFGVWDNQNDVEGPCYTLLFENMAQEKRNGGPVRIHSPRPQSPVRNEDLYTYNPASIKAVRKSRHLPGLLCCFVGS